MLTSGLRSTAAHASRLSRSQLSNRLGVSRSSSCIQHLESTISSSRREPTCRPLRFFSCAPSIRSDDIDSHQVLEDFKQSLSFAPATCDLKELGQRHDTITHKKVVLHGYLGNVRQASKKLMFAELHSVDQTHFVQIVAVLKDETDPNDPFNVLQSLNALSPVAIHGATKLRKAKPASSREVVDKYEITELEINVSQVQPLNRFPDDIFVREDRTFPPEQRHMQIRTDRALREALVLRSRACSIARNELCAVRNFVEVETPLLFKSTPEGAREFLVPTRTKGLAYALPQSPQQYKQILMASGITRYVQFAKCFRDEDLRADRQPEFTQVDLEMAFATGEDVMNVIEQVVKKLWLRLTNATTLPEKFPRMTYEEAMSRFGSDKPDLRLGTEISRIEYMLPVDLISKIGPLTDPIVEVIKLPISSDPAQTRDFVNSFMESPDARPFISNPHGQPGIFIYDSRRPLSGLQVFGFEAAEQLEESLDLQEGDLLVIQARPKARFHGGSTPLGNLRLALHKAGVKASLLPKPQGLHFLWITDFPLFTPSSSDAAEPGQGGHAGLSSTHHPFTAPKTAADVDLLASDPLAAKAEHYDLVLNGVELGGGSRRIHSSAMQTYVLREVLKMDEARLADFAHLVEVLRAGCPPHAGMALGFDRLVAVMLGRESVRDVIAFPKSGSGEDPLVRSPTMMTEGQLETYHLRLREGEKGKVKEKE